MAVSVRKDSTRDPVKVTNQQLQQTTVQLQVSTSQLCIVRIHILLQTRIQSRVRLQQTRAELTLYHTFIR